jgi:hypothetical protein
MVRRGRLAALFLAWRSQGGRDHRGQQRRERASAKAIFGWKRSSKPTSTRNAPTARGSLTWALTSMQQNQLVVQQ